MINNPKIIELYKTNPTIYHCYWAFQHLNDYELLELMVIKLAEQNDQLSKRLYEEMCSKTKIIL